jgi:hypothetical protein
MSFNDFGIARMLTLSNCPLCSPHILPNQNKEEDDITLLEGTGLTA